MFCKLWIRKDLFAKFQTVSVLFMFITSQDALEERVFLRREAHRRHRFRCSNSRRAAPSRTCELSPSEPGSPFCRDSITTAATASQDGLPARPPAPPARPHEPLRLLLVLPLSAASLSRRACAGLPLSRSEPQAAGGSRGN